MLENGINPYVEKMLDYTAKRQQAISNNIANLDTPGYTAKDVEFHEELSSASEISNVELDDKVKPNGNNVDLETQMTKMTQNGLQYVMLVQYLTSDIKTLRSAITDGGKG
jgi:flagellar basal-body rod protein FlgB